jgi:hypothetical protein
MSIPPFLQGRDYIIWFGLINKKDAPLFFHLIINSLPEDRSSVMSNPEELLAKMA